MSRWLEPPLKVPDALQKIADALHERQVVAGLSPSGLKINNFPMAKNRANYSNAAWYINRIYQEMYYLRRQTIILPSDLNTWAKPRPLYNNDDLNKFLSDNGFEPNYFFIGEHAPYYMSNHDKNPMLVSDARYYDIVYFLMNDCLRCFSDVNIHNYPGSVYVGESLQKDIVYNVEGWKNIADDLSGFMRCAHGLLGDTYENNPFPTKWKISVPVKIFGAVGNDAVNFFDNPKLITTYDRIVEFDGATAYYQSQVDEFVDLETYQNADEAYLIECIGMDKPVDSHEDYLPYGDVLSYSKIFLPDFNFPELQYYDPLQ